MHVKIKIETKHKLLNCLCPSKISISMNKIEHIYIKIWKRRKFFNEIVYEMLSDIKAYQSEIAGQRSPSKNYPSCCTRVVCLQRIIFDFD